MDDYLETRICADLARRLRSARENAGLSISALSKALDNTILIRTIRQYEVGEMIPSIEVLFMIAKVLRMELADFLMEPGCRVPGE